ncbi:hypothetical protein MMC09_004381 [Bachmanniomyces sp. S44760]|nr:hypothetical protein [Bachmanniomyces sp. S44760]
MSKKADTPYPTSHSIEDLFNTPTGFRDAILAPLDDNVDAKIVGYDHHFAGEHKGKEALTKNLRDEIACIVDEDKVHYEVINVIGGGDSPWAAIEAKATGKSKTGKKLVHEHVYVVRFNGQGKIVKLRAYFDTHHLHNHAVDQGKASA